MLSSTSQLFIGVGTLCGSLGDGISTPEAEIARMRIALESLKSLREKRAALMIQSRFRAFCARKKFIAIVHSRYILQVLRPVITIQATWKRHRIVCMIKLRVFSKVVTSFYASNATKIARWYKSTSNNVRFREISAEQIEGVAANEEVACAAHRHRHQN